jgi:hypothetical protein
MTLDQLESVFRDTPNAEQHMLEVSLGDIRKWCEERNRLREHLEWFVQRVDAGEVRSTKSYNRFKSELIRRAGGADE